MQYDSTKYEKSELIRAYQEKISGLCKVLEEKTEELKAEFEKDCTDIDKTDLISEQNKVIKLYQKYIMKASSERSIFNKIKVKKDQMEAEITDYYRFHWDKSTKLTETAINKNVSAHPCYMSMITYFNLVKELIEFLDNAIEIFKTKNFAIKNIIEVRKIELGMN